MQYRHENRRRARVTATLAAMIALCATSVGCRFDDPSDAAAESSSAGDVQATKIDARYASDATLPVMDWNSLIAAVHARADSTDHMLRQVRDLTRRERSTLRRDVNALQIAHARRLGIPRSADVSALVQSGQLVPIDDDAQLWTLYHLNYSVPYVTPDTDALLNEIATRFQTTLDSLNVPRYRLVITSALRSAEKQAALRRANPNASKIVSAHEFGTTVDLAYRRFASPLEYIAAPDPALGGTDVAFADSVMEETANLRSAELQAVLGRILLDLRSRGQVLVMMERQQTVYHITLGKPYDPARR
jgi:hypothetical protein